MDRNLSPVEDKTCSSQPFWLRCVDCGGAVATAVVPEIPDTVTMVARPLLKMLAIKLNAPPELRATVGGDKPFAFLADPKLLPTLFTLRCADCTVKANGEASAA